MEGPRGRLEGHALLMPDGAFRMRLEADAPAAKAHLVGQLAMDRGHASGSGILIGEACGLPEPNAYCDDTGTWQITLDMISVWVDHGAKGELVLTTAAGDERWQVKTGYWGGIAHFGPNAWGVDGQFIERLAEFAGAGDVVMNVDAAGRWFFQSPQTGCTGNGSLTPYASTRNAHAVELTIAGCTGSFSHLNGAFEGLSTMEAWDPWDYGSLYHKMWLSTAAGPARPAALAFLAERVR